MGKVRPKFIKNVANELVERFPGIFTEDFETNKILLDEYIETEYKSIKNKIAGYLVRVVQNQGKNYEAVRKDFSKRSRKIDKRKEK